MRTNHLIILFTTLIVLGISVVSYAALTPLEGTVSGIDYSAGTFYIGDTFVYTTDATVVTLSGVSASFDQITNNSTVRVMGTATDDGFMAAKICIKNVCDGSRKGISACECPNGGVCDGGGPYGPYGPRNGR